MRSSRWPAAGGEMAARVRRHDWARTPLGPVETWPQSLRTAVELVLASGHPMQLAWGPERTILYNDACVPVLGDRHPRALGLPFREAWPDNWAGVEPLVERVFAGETVRFEEPPSAATRRGRPEEARWDVSCSPVRDEAGAVAGLLSVAVDATPRVRAGRERDEARTRLGDGEERFRALATAGSHSVYRMSPDWRRMIELRGRDFLADTPEPTEGWWDTYILEEDRPFVRRAIDEAVRGRSTFELEHRVRRADGGVGWTRSRAVPILGDDGTVVEWFGTATDVSERKRTEDALRAGEERHRAELERQVSERTAELRRSRDLLRATMDSSADMIQVFEAVRDGGGEIADFRWALNNHASETIYGDVVGQSLLANNPGVLDEGIFDAFKGVVETGAPHRAERHYVHEQFDGWFFQSAVKLGDGVATTTRDITDWKRAQEEVLRLQQDVADSRLKESEDRFRALVTASSHMIYRMSPDWRRMDRLDGRGVLADTAAPTEDWADLYLLPEDRPAIFAAIDEAIRTRSPFELEHRVRGADGGVGWVLSRAVPIFGPDGEISEWFGAGTDVSARKEAEEALRESEERQAFLLQLSDALRPLADPVRIQSEAARVIGEHLGAGRAAYAEIDADDAHFTVHRDYTDGVPSFAGRHPLDSYGPEFWADFRAGRTVSVADAEDDPRISEAERAPYAAGMVRAAIGVPLVKEGRLAAVFFLHYPAPHEWTADHVALVEETAERTWAAMERARAEAALRDSEERLRLALDAAEMGSFRWRVPTDHSEPDARMQAMFGVSSQGELNLSAALAKVIHPEDKRSYAEAVDRALDPGGDGQFREDFRAVLPSGEVRWITITGQVRFGGDPPRAEWMHGVAMDITERRQAEDALRESEERFRQLVETSAQAVWEADAEGAIVEDSPSWRAYTGQTLDEWLGYGWLQAIHPDDREHAERNWRESMAAKRTVDAEFRLRRAGGGWRWTNVRAAPLLDPDRSIRKWVGMNTDIDARKAAEIALRESEEALAADLANAELLRGLAERLVTEENAGTIYDEILSVANAVAQADAGTVQIYDARTKSLDLIAAKNFSRSITDYFHRVDAGSRTACGIALNTGRRAFVDFPDEVADSGCSLLVGEGLQSAMALPLVSRTGKPLGMLNTHWRKARHRPTDKQLRFLDLIARQVADLIEQRQAQAVLRDSEARLRAAFSISTVGVMFWSGDGALVDMNDAFGRMTGFAREEALGKTWRELTPPEFLERSAEFVEEVETTGEGQPYEKQYFRKDGSRWWGLFAARKLDVGMVEFVLDVSDRREAEARLRESEERLRLAVEAGGFGSFRWFPAEDRSEPDARTRAILGASSAEKASLAEVLGKRVHPDDAALHAAAVARALDPTGDGRIGNEIRVVHPSGEVRWVAMTGQVRFGGDPPVARWMDGIAADVTERKEAEARSRESEERLRQFGEASSDILWIRDADTLQWEYLSPAFEPIYGLSRDEALTGDNFRNWADLVLPEDRERAVSSIERVGAGERVTFEYRIRRPSDGAVRWLRNTDFPIYDEAGRVARIGGVGQDFTERREAEDRLRESEEGFRTLADTVPQLVWMGEEPSAQYYNRRWYEYTGLTDGESLGTRAWQEIVHPDERALAVERSERSARTGEPYEMEYRLRRADGAYRWNIARAVRQPGTRRWIGAATDIDDLRRARDALAESEERFRSFAENSADTLWIVDARTGRLEYLSPAFREMWGEERERISDDLGRWAELVHPDDRERAAEGMPRLLAGEVHQQTYRIVRPDDGAVRFIQDTGFPVRDGDGRVRRVAGIAQDVTEARVAAHAVRRSERRLRALVEGIPQLVWRAVDGGEWTWSSPQWTEFTGLSPEESRGHGWLRALHPDDRERAMECWREAEETGALAVEYRLRHAAENRHRWFSTRATAVRDEDGRVVEWLGTSTDIDDLRRLQEHGKLLVAELQHRVRNTLGVIRSVARRTADTSDTVEDYAMHLDGRINAFARVQAAVTRDPASGIDLERLVADELRAHGAQEGDRVRSIEGPKVLLKPKAAETLALAVHELATNAVKYGALSTGKGRIAVAWRFEAADGRRRLLLRWTESGVKLAGGKPRRRGFGTELIERTLAYDLGGEAVLDFTADGLTCLIGLPAGDQLLAKEPG